VSAVVISRSKIEGADRFAERNHHAAANNPRMRSPTSARMLK
jgi:hypothetical protein